MKEELQGKLVEILTSIQSAAGKASDFALEQLPDIAQSYVAYGRAYTTVIAVLSAAIFLCGFWAVAKVRSLHKEGDAKYEAAKAKGDNGYLYRGQFFEASDLGPITYVPFAIGAFAFMVNLEGVLLTWFAPKVWLLKQLALLTK